MEAICRLNRLWRALPSAFRVRTGTVSDDDLNSSVCAQPIGKDLASAILKRVNGPVRL